MDCYEAIDLMGDELEGNLPAGARAGFDEHMAECAPCCTYHQQLRLTRDLLGRLPAQEKTLERRSELLARFERENGPEA